MELKAESTRFVGEFDRKIGRLADDLVEHRSNLVELATATRELMEAELKSIRRVRRAFRGKAVQALRRLAAFRESIVARLETCREEKRTEELDVALRGLATLLQEIRSDLLPKDTRAAISAAVEARVKAARASIEETLTASRKVRGGRAKIEAADDGEEEYGATVCGG